MKIEAVQADNPNYALHSLGWKSFQQLCLSIVGEIWGQTIQGFFDSRDGGRDGAFYGKWEDNDGEIYIGSFTVQCKHTSDPSKVIKPRDLIDECKKAARLSKKGLADNYFLFTNAKLTGESDELITTMFSKIPGLNKFRAYGVERISQLIQENSRLRMLVPRVYGLGDLSQIFDQRVYSQAREILTSLGDDLSKFVITKCYNKSVKALTNHNFVILLGEPACGKSTIAAALAMGALDQWEMNAIKIIDPQEIITHSNPYEPQQLFWIDDAFGSTQFDRNITDKWNKTFPHINAAIRRGAKFVMTSRDYIFNSAKNVLKTSSLPIIGESRVVIKVEDLTKEEKEYILYNHIKLGTQTKSFKGKIKIFLPRIVEHIRFSPEIARRLGNPLFTTNLELTEAGVDNFVGCPMDFLREIIQTLDSASLSAIGLLFAHGGRLVSPLNIGSEEKKILDLLGATRAEVVKALDTLKGSLVNINIANDRYYWVFKHPTIRDAFASLVIENPELLDIYLAGTPLFQLFTEISCGDVGLQGVKVVVPSDRYELILNRLVGFDLKKYENKTKIFSFLSYRCDKGFLNQLIARFPKIMKSFHVHSMLYANSDINVICRLNEFGLLPEENRLNYIEIIRTLAIEIPDPGFLQENIKSLHTNAEYSETVNVVREKLIPNLGSIISDFESDYNEVDDPGEHFGSLINSLEEFLSIFNPCDSEYNDIKSAISSVELIIEDKNGDYTPPKKKVTQQISNIFNSMPTRSIFDDIDQ